jgi:hypothetical protein
MGACLGKTQKERIKMAQCQLSDKLKGSKVVNQRLSQAISGDGSILGNIPIVQEKCLFEIKIVKEGPFCLGVAGKSTDCEKILEGQFTAWCYSWEEHAVFLGNELKLPMKKKIEVNIGDVFGCAFDQSSIQIYHNGSLLQYDVPLSIKPLKGPVFPAFSVSSPTAIQCVFDAEDFSYPLDEQGFTALMSERSIV